MHCIDKKKRFSLFFTFLSTYLRFLLVPQYLSTCSKLVPLKGIETPEVYLSLDFLEPNAFVIIRAQFLPLEPIGPYELPLLRTSYQIGVKLTTSGTKFMN